jgi:hypothetical protein
MELTQQLRGSGLEEKAVEFKEKGGEIYVASGK